MKFSLLFIFLFFLIACNRTSNNNSAASSVSNVNIPLTRKTVNPNAVAIYKEEVKSFATTDGFIVSLFETKNTFDYLIKISYQNLNVTDTLNVPDFGSLPKVDIKKGDKRPSCIVGFLDNNNQFRESKLIYMDDNTLKVHVLKHYAVTTYEDTLKN